MNQNVYGDADNFQWVAGYAEGMARNHAFVDGNKRTAFAVADFSYAGMAMPDKLVMMMGTST